MDRLRQSVESHIPQSEGGRKLPGKADVMAGVTTGIANVPDGMASGVLAGVNPIFGIYTLIIGTPISALAASTQLMMFNTTSAMTLVATDGLGDRTGDDRVQALIAVALIAGVFQLALGLLGLGMLTKFVSNSVMVGFLSGIAALILMGQLWDLTGYSGEGGSKLEQTAQLLGNLGDVDPATTFLGVGSIVLMVALSYAPKVSNFNLLIALGIAIVVQAIFDFDSVAMVGEVPRSLPNLEVPKFSVVPAMLLAGIATGAVGLLQAAGVAQAFPNPDGSETSDSRDFSAQGAANIATSLFQGMAGGGSLSGTALNVSAGARTRYAAVVQAGVVLVFILVFAGLLAKIPSAALAALLVYAAALSIKWGAIATVSKTSWMSLAAMIITFAATLVVPLQQAVIFGVLVASILFIYRASTDVRLFSMSVQDGRLVFSDPPQLLPDNQVTVLDVEGSLFYAGARTLSERLPDATSATNAVVVMRIRGQSEVGSTFFKVIGKYAGQIRENGGRLILAGVEQTACDRMLRSGNLDDIGAENVFLATSVLGDSTVSALEYGQQVLAGSEPTERPRATETAVAPAAEPVPMPAAALDIPTTEEGLAIDESASLIARIGPIVERYIPWRAASTLRATGVFGAIVTATGLLMILNRNLVDSIFRFLTGGLLLLIAMFWLYQTLSESKPEISTASALRMFSAGMAMIAGTALVLAEFVDLMTVDSARLILGFTLIFIGIVGIASTWFRLLSARQRTAAMAINGFTAVLGLISLVQLRNGENFFDRLGWLMLAGGIALLVYAYYLLREAQGAVLTESAGESVEPVA